MAFGGPSPVKSGEVRPRPRIQPLAGRWSQLQTAGPRRSLRHKDNLCSHPRRPPAAGAPPRSSGHERGGKLVGIISTARRKARLGQHVNNINDHLEPRGYQQRRQRSASVPFAPFPLQIPKPKSAAQSSGPPWGSFFDLTTTLPPNKLHTEAGPPVPQSQGRIRVIEVDGQCVVVLEASGQVAIAADRPHLRPLFRANRGLACIHDKPPGHWRDANCRPLKKPAQQTIPTPRSTTTPGPTGDLSLSPAATGSRGRCRAVDANA